MLENSILSINVSRLRRLLVNKSCSTNQRPPYSSTNQIPITIRRQTSRFATSEKPMANAHSANASESGSLCHFHLPRHRLMAHQMTPAASKTSMVLRYCGVRRPSPVPPPSAANVKSTVKAASSNRADCFLIDYLVIYLKLP